MKKRLLMSVFAAITMAMSASAHAGGKYIFTSVPLEGACFYPVADETPGGTMKVFAPNISGGTYAVNKIPIINTFTNTIENSLPLALGETPWYGQFTVRSDTHECYISMFNSGNGSAIRTISAFDTSKFGPEVNVVGDMAGPSRMDAIHGNVVVLVHKLASPIGPTGWYVTAIDANRNEIPGYAQYLTQYYLWNMEIDPIRGLVYMPDYSAGVTHILNTTDGSLVHVSAPNASSAYPNTTRYVAKDQRVYILGSYNDLNVFAGLTLFTTIHIPIGFESDSLADNPSTGDVFATGDYDLDGSPHSGYISTVNNAEIVGQPLRVGTAPLGGSYNGTDGNMLFADYSDANGTNRNGWVKHTENRMSLFRSIFKIDPKTGFPREFNSTEAAALINKAKMRPDGKIHVVYPDGTFTSKPADQPYDTIYVNGETVIATVDHPAIIFAKPVSR